MGTLPHLENVFPCLAAAGYEETSKETGRPPKRGAYNCIAWAAHDTHRWWWPDQDSYWPFWVQKRETVDCFVESFRWLGYRECESSRHEFAFEKVALYAMHVSGNPMTPPKSLNDFHDWEPKHMARQLPDGTWTSKAGEHEDLTHFTLDAVESYGQRYWDFRVGLFKRSGYGSPVLFMRRFIVVSWIVRSIQQAHWILYGRWRN